MTCNLLLSLFSRFFPQLSITVIFKNHFFHSHDVFLASIEQCFYSYINALHIKIEYREKQNREERIR